MKVYVGEPLFTSTNHLFLLSFLEVGPPKNLITSDVKDTGFAVSWTAAPGNVKMYQVRWKSLFFPEESGEMMVPGDVTNTVLQTLSPETPYQVTVVATYDHKDSDPLVGQETTDGKRQQTLCARYMWAEF